MKFLIVLLVVLVGVFIWRNNRRSERVERNQRTAQRTPAEPPKLEDMVSCPVCALHLPAADALPGRTGAWYCSASHRQQAEG